MNKTLILFIFSVILIVTQGILLNTLDNTFIGIVLIIIFILYVNRGTPFFKTIKSIYPYLNKDENFQPIFWMFVTIIYCVTQYLNTELHILIYGIFLLIAGCSYCYYSNDTVKSLQKNKTPIIDNSKSEEEEYTDDIYNEPIENTIYRFRMALKEGEYQFIINVDNKIDTTPYYNNNEIIREYYLIVGIAYQEIGNLRHANKCFDIYMGTLKELKSNDKDVPKNTIELLILMKEIEDLGFTYKK